MSKQALLKSHKMGDIVLNNRVVMAPMTRSRAVNDDNAPTEDLRQVVGPARRLLWSDATQLEYARVLRFLVVIAG